MVLLFSPQDVLMVTHEAVHSHDIAKLDLSIPFPNLDFTYGGVTINLDVSNSSNGTSLRANDIVNALQDKAELRQKPVELVGEKTHENHQHQRSRYYYQKRR